MGEAKRRGTFEQRKEQAIAAGRIKRAKTSAKRLAHEIESKMSGGFIDLLSFLTGASKRARLRRLSKNI